MDFIEIANLLWLGNIFGCSWILFRGGGTGSRIGLLRLRFNRPGTSQPTSWLKMNTSGVACVGKGVGEARQLVATNHEQGNT